MTAIITNTAIDNLRSFRSYLNSRYLSIKHNSYFQVYEELLEKYIGKPITFVEIGVLDGGSLFMWRDYFGPEARIIGIELNPNAKKWETEGFEIYIGNQADPDFWDAFFSAVGPIDILLDDGGHTNAQQIITSHKAIDHIKDGGLIMIEDVHASYLKRFGNPSRYSFMNFAKNLVDAINSRYPEVKAAKNNYANKVYSVSFYESIVALHIDSRKCFASSPISNKGIAAAAEDYRHQGSVQRFFIKISEKLNISIRSPFVFHIRNIVFNILARIQDVKLRKYFR